MIQANVQVERHTQVCLTAMLTVTLDEIMDMDQDHLPLWQFLRSGLISLMSDQMSGVKICETIKLFISYVNDNASTYTVGASHKHDNDSSVAYENGVMCEGFAPSLFMLKTFKENNVSFQGKSLSIKNFVYLSLAILMIR
jgi:hypothetical protein